ncbi:MAG: hypothetical protein AABX89_05325 [Candidatus Thermoplasmatota archaeon]
MPDVTPSADVPESDGARELRMQRAELEREFEEKLRDLKAQERRRVEALRRDREEWEATRRATQSDLANRAEAVRRAEERHKQDVDALRKARAELERLRAEAGGREAARIEAKAGQAKLAAKVETLRSSRTRSGPILAVGAAALTGCLVATLIAPGAVVVIAALGLFALLALALGRRGRTPP